MEDMNRRKPGVPQSEILIVINRIGEERMVKRQALEDVTDELR